MCCLAHKVLIPSLLPLHPVGGSRWVTAWMLINYENLSVYYFVHNSAKVMAGKECRRRHGNSLEGPTFFFFLEDSKPLPGGFSCCRSTKGKAPTLGTCWVSVV